VIVLVILGVMAATDRLGCRYHVTRTGREINSDMTEERRDAGITDRSGGLVIPPHRTRDRTPPDR
jgi:hypothetical protein